MKSFIRDVVPMEEMQERTYPYIGDYDNTIVLFVGEGVGTVIADTSGAWSVGSYDTEWDEDQFVEFTREVVLRN